MGFSAYKQHIIALFKRTALLLVLFSLSRLVFVIFNISYIQEFNFKELGNAFFYGIRFDFIVIFYFNVLFVAVHLFPFGYAHKPWAQKSLKFLFVVVNSILLLGNLIDVEYFGYTNKRSGWEMLDMLMTSSDTAGMIPNYIASFWYLVLILGLFIWSMIRYYPGLGEWKAAARPSLLNSYIFPVLLSLVLFGLAFIFSRGLDKKPIRIISANNYTSPAYIPILLNTPFSIMHTVNQYSLEEKHYFNSEDVNQIFSPVQSFKSDDGFKNQNVVIVILESFGKEYIEAHDTPNAQFAPFLDSLRNEGLDCELSLANAYRSMDAISAIIAGFPSMMNSSFVSSAYSVNEIRALPHVLAEEGYQSAFFHGGHNGTMGFDMFCKAAGIDAYYGKSEYGNDDHFDGTWGIYDEEFFAYMVDELNGFQEPFLSVLFSLSSHDPYPIPEHHAGKFPEGELEIMQSIAYTDYALKKMFEKASQEEWYENTLFVICADHTSLPFHESYKNAIGRVSIPILFFHPGDSSLRGQHLRVASQLDISPSILDYLAYEGEYNAYGSSIFSNDYAFSVSYNDVNYQMIDSSHVLLFDGEKSIALYNHRKDPRLNTNLIDTDQWDFSHMEKILKAYIQDYNFRMNHNLLARPEAIGIE